MGTPAVEENRSTQDLGIEFEHVDHSFIHGNRAVLVLKDFSPNIEPAEFVSIVGPSGCGKTTALSMTGGLVRPRSGSVRLGGTEVKGTSDDIAFLLMRTSSPIFQHHLETLSERLREEVQRADQQRTPGSDDD
ncbi:ATP-binding cassette domain-containing protein [Saccharopolyspora shandongensis]|uniref:ATP-binding cassette domain-containing protein n=1 Tax=Saccharopolyspora shandongensis TaxID=418495 RepID=UPI003427D2A2